MLKSPSHLIFLSAVAHLWRDLRCPVYCTAFTAAILADVEPWREGDRLALPQSAHLLLATAT